MMQTVLRPTVLKQHSAQLAPKQEACEKLKAHEVLEIICLQFLTNYTMS